jgi:hypothetical protein
VSYRIALVCEGPTDLPVVRALVNRLIVEVVDWAAGQMDDVITWVGYEPGTQYMAWRTTKLRAEPVSRKVFGDHLPSSREAFTARKALLLFDQLPSERRPDAVILQRDTDRDAVREADLVLARDNFPWKFVVVLGVARPMVESWILAGFIPTDDESDRHRTMCSHLGFDPCQSGERLSPQHADLTKRPKHVLEALTRADPTRVQTCYEITPFAHLRQTGANNGLGDFLDEVRTRLVPALGGPHPT